MAFITNAATQRIGELMSRRVVITFATCLVALTGLLSGQASATSGVQSSSNDSTGKVWLSTDIGGEFSCGIRLDHTLWCWGANTRGQLGLGHISGGEDLPTQVGIEDDWAQVSGGFMHMCAVRLDHTLWCTGWNSDYGQLGLGDKTDRSSLTQVGSDANWASVSAGGNFTCGLRTDSSLWCWGGNNAGQVGIGHHAGTLVPRPVRLPALGSGAGSGTEWLEVAAGDVHACGIRTDGTLWCWGSNRSGELGLGDVTNRWIPTQVGADSNWTQLASGVVHTCGIRNDHTLWCWGDNHSGELGLGDTDDRHVPTQVGSAIDWTQVTTNYYYSCAVRAQGTAWCWGGNARAQLGLGDKSGRRVPTQVGTLGGWSVISAGSSHTCALRENHSLWCWGRNSYGELGIGLGRRHHKVPVRV